MGNDGVQAVAETLRYNTKLEKLVLRNTGCSKEAGIFLGECLHFNKQSHLTHIDLGSNQFEVIFIALHEMMELGKLNYIIVDMAFRTRVCPRLQQH
jgi:hypothetical protein